MPCTILLSTASDTVISSSGCETGIDFQVSPGLFRRLGSGELVFQPDGSVSGTVQYLQTPQDAEPGANECLYRVTEQHRDETIGFVFNSDKTCSSFRLTVDEVSMFANGNKANITIDINKIGLSLGSTSSVEPSVGISPNGGGGSATTIAIVIGSVVALAIFVIFMVVLVRRRQKR